MDVINELDMNIQLLVEKRQPLYVQRDMLNDEIIKLTKQIEKQRDAKDKEVMKQPMSSLEEMEYFLFDDGSVSGARYKAREKYWDAKGLMHSGYFSEVNQVNLKMVLYKGKKDNLETTISALEEVIPMLKVHEDGVKRLDIFEHTGNQDGCWSVEINEKSFDLILHRYHRKTTQKSFDNLRQLVEYVQANHYYEEDDE